MGVPRDNFSFGWEDSAYKATETRGTKKHIDGNIMRNIEPYCNILVTETGMKEYCSRRAEWFFGCSMKRRHASAFDVVGPLWGKKRWAEKIDTSSCIEEPSGSAQGYIVNATAEADFVCRLRRFSNA